MDCLKFMLYARLPVISRLSVVKFWTVKSYRFSAVLGVSAPNFYVVHVSTLYIHADTYMYTHVSRKGSCATVGEKLRLEPIAIIVESF